MDGESKYRNICGNYAYILCFKRFLHFFEKSACNLKKAVVLLLSRRERRQNKIVGVDCREGPPVPIPNTEVKLAGAEDTWLETARKNRFSPTQKNHLCKQVVFLRLRRASRGALAAARFTRSETPAICPRWLRWLRWLRHRQFAGRSLPLASPGEKHWLSVREGWLGV